MNDSKVDWSVIEEVVQEIVRLQQQKLLACGQQMIATLTDDDILQPNDFSELEMNPLFRYEEGVLAGMQTVQMALQAIKKEDTKMQRHGDSF